MGLFAMGDHERWPVVTPVLATKVVDVAREVVRQLEPEELAVFDDIAEFWVSGRSRGRRRGREPGAAVGFGIEAVLLSELLFPIISGALGQTLGTSITERAGHRLRLTRKAAVNAAAAAPAGGAGGGRVSEDARLTVEQLRSVHEVCLRDAATLGMTPEKALLLADAVVGALSATPGRSGP